MSGFLSRRELIAAGAALAATRAFARESADQQLMLTGQEAQGGLVIGDAGDGSQVWIEGAPVRVNDGMFCFGFGRDAVRPMKVRIRHVDGSEFTRLVNPRKRNFIVQRINGLPEQYVSPPPDILARIKRDAQAVAEARRTDTGETWFTEQFAWPADGPITSIYGSQRILNGEPREPHYGVDIASPEGTPIHAPVRGVVTLAEELYLSGNTAIVDHGHGVSTSYLHMSRMDVKPGDKLDKGQQIGLIGHTGRATGPHLCWRLNWFQTRLDVALVAPPRPRDRV